MKRQHILITTLAVAAALGVPATASAGFTASRDGNSVTLTSDAAADAVTITIDGDGDLAHGLSGGGFEAPDDWDTTEPGSQTVTAATADVTVNGGDGDDNLAFGPDVVVAAALLDGGAGNDGVEVNGSATAGDEFTVKPNAQRIRFDRVNLEPFSLDIGSTERMEVNGLGGADHITVDNGLGTLLLTLSGGVGPDTIIGADTQELILGGEDDDTLTGGAGDDRIVGNRGADTFKGGAGDDTLVYDNGDGSDVMDGDDGLDVVEVNGALAQGDAFTIAPNGARARFDRTNLVPFSLDIGTAEGLGLNALGGDDTFQATDRTALALFVDGGSGNDTLTGASSFDTLSGGTGDDTLTGGNGLDALDGQSGNDRIEARDGAPDLVRCGEGTDTAIADQARLDALESCETAERLPEAATRGKAMLERASVRRRSGRQQVSFRVSCADAPCTVVLSVRTARRIKVGRIRARVLLAERIVTLTPGQTRTFRLTLPRRAERVARRRIQARMLFEGTVSRRTLRTR